MHRWIGIVALGATLLFGCGDDDAPGMDGGPDGTADATPDAGDGGADAELAPLAVEVVTYSLSREGQEQPGSGARVEVWQADGVTLQQTADDQGRVSFEAVDFGPGPVAVTGYLTDLPLTSVVAVTAEDSPVALRIKRPIPVPPGVTVSGTAQHMTAAGNVLSVTASRPVTLNHQVGADYSLEVEQGRPLALTYTEWWPGMIRSSGRGVNNTIFHWYWAPLPALADATTLDPDFDLAVTPEVVRGSFPIPTRPESPFQSEGIGFVGVTTRDSNLLYGLGLPTHADITPDATGFEYELEWIEVPGVIDPVTLYLLVNDPWQVDIWAFVLVDGYPTAGAQDIRFFDMPDLLSPGVGQSQGLHDPVRFRPYDDDFSAALQIHRYDEIAWEVYRLDGGGEIEVPPVPQGLDAEALLGTEPLDAQVVLFELAPAGNYLRRATFSDYFTLLP